MDALSHASASRSKAKSGDIAVCTNCGAVMMLDDDLRLRGMTSQEMDELTSDQNTMNDIARAVKIYHLVKLGLGRS